MSQQAPVRPQYLTPDEVSQRYGGHISVGTLANWRSGRGDGPEFVRIGGRILYPLVKLIAWEQRHTFRSTRDYKAA